MTAPRIPKPSTATFRASVHLSKSGSLTPEQLFAAVHFGDKPSSRLIALDSAVRTGWLVEVNGLIGNSDAAAAHHIVQEIYEPTIVAPTGQKAMPRTAIPVYERPALSKRYMPSSKGFRDDAPEFSVRSAPSFHSVGGAS